MQTTLGLGSDTEFGNCWWWHCFPKKKNNIKDIKKKKFTFRPEQIFKRKDLPNGPLRVTNYQRLKVTCSSGGSVRDRPDILMLGMHFVMSHMILTLTVVISESKSQMIRIVLVCNLCNSCPLFPLRCMVEPK